MTPGDYNLAGIWPLVLFLSHSHENHYIRENTNSIAMLSCYNFCAMLTAKKKKLKAMTSTAL